MIDELTAWITWSGFMVAKAGLFGFLAGDNENSDDGMVADAHAFVIDALSDADKARKIKAITGKELRDLSLQEIQQIDREMKLRRFPRRN